MPNVIVFLRSLHIIDIIDVKMYPSKVDIYFIAMSKELCYAMKFTLHRTTHHETSLGLSYVDMKCTT